MIRDRTVQLEMDRDQSRTSLCCRPTCTKPVQNYGLHDACQQWWYQSHLHHIRCMRNICT